MQGQMAREWPLVAGFSAEQIRNAIVWTMFAVSFVVFVEPAPVDLMFLCVLVGFFSGRFNPSIAIMPLIMMLLVYNVGGVGSFFAERPDPRL